MTEQKRPRYILRELLAVTGALFAGTTVFLLLCVLFRRQPRTLAALCAGFALYLGAAAFVFFRVCLKKLRRSEQLMELYAAGYTTQDVSRLDCYFSRGTELALKHSVALLDTGKLLSLSKRQAQYLALQNQINPHFLYNTLEGIRSEALAAGLDTVADMTEYLARYFRYTISRVENLVPVSDELENIRIYFAIQQFRFKERLRLVIDCPEDERAIRACRIPKLTLQPIVENAIIHGLEGKLGTGTVRISLRLTTSRLVIRISDDGVGMPPEQLRALTEALCKTDYTGGGAVGGIALQNVNNRIRLLFGEEYSLVLHSIQNVGTDVTVTLPAGAAGAGEEPL